MFTDLFLTFVPIFVAVDPIGVMPIFLSLTQGLSSSQKKRIIFHSVITGLVLAFGFIFLGKTIFCLLGITVADFLVAGGSLLFIISIVDIVSPVKTRRLPPEDLGVVPLGTPIMVGPAVLTTSLILVDAHGLLPTLISVVANIIIAGLIFTFSDIVIKILGEAGSKAISKVTSLILAAIAIMMIRKGLVQMGFIR